MIVLSHRGYWKEISEKNSATAFHRSFSLGFGTETDIRDFDGKLVISHDPASRDSISLEEFFDIYNTYSKKLMLALNIKSDGLQKKLQSALAEFGIGQYFIFDMAVPDGLLYLRQGMATYTRHSEYETVPAYYEDAKGVWLDEFHEHWITSDVIESHLGKGKAVCIVSPDLHSRPYNKEWEHYRELEKKIGKDRLMLCTDFPEEAREFFDA
jgi:glycerophosphoryl diester phosphodiesterase